MENWIHMSDIQNSKPIKDTREKHALIQSYHSTGTLSSVLNKSE